MERIIRSIGQINKDHSYTLRNIGGDPNFLTSLSIVKTNEDRSLHSINYDSDYKPEIDETCFRPGANVQFIVTAIACQLKYLMIACKGGPVRVFYLNNLREKVNCRVTDQVVKEIKLFKNKFILLAGNSAIVVGKELDLIREYQCKSPVKGLFAINSKKYAVDKEGRVYRMRSMGVTERERKYTQVMNPEPVNLGPIDKFYELMDLQNLSTQFKYAFVQFENTYGILRLGTNIECIDRKSFVDLQNSKIDLKVNEDMVYYRIIDNNTNENPTQIFVQFLFDPLIDANILDVNPLHINNFVVQDSKTFCITDENQIVIFNFSHVKTHHLMIGSTIRQICATNNHLIMYAETLGLVTKNLNIDKSEICDECNAEVPLNTENDYKICAHYFPTVANNN